MDEHISFLKTSCRLCGNQVKGKSDVADKQSFKLELWLRFQINVDVDSDEIHPSVICPACKRVLYLENLSRVLLQCECVVANILLFYLITFDKISWRNVQHNFKLHVQLL